MSNARIWLGQAGSEELLKPTGRKLTENDVIIDRSGRTSSGKMVRDIIATKKEFTLSYEMTTNEVMVQLEQIYALGYTLNLKIERKDGNIDSYTVLMQPVKRTRINAKGSWLHSLSVVLEEV